MKSYGRQWWWQRLPGSICHCDTAVDDDVDAPYRNGRSSLNSSTSTFGRSGGRTVRVVVAGPSRYKTSLVEALRYGSRLAEEGRGGLGGRPPGARRGASVLTEIAGSARGRSGVIFSVVPARDLDSARADAEFEAYLEVASCAVVCVDDDDPRWTRDALRWVDVIRERKRMPVALVVSRRGDADAADVAIKANAFCANAGDAVLGWFYRDEGGDDGCGPCMDALLGAVAAAHRGAAAWPSLAFF